MSGIGTSIEIQDKVSGSLNRITAALYSTTSAFEGVDKASDVAFNPSSVQAITQELYKYENEIQDIQGQLDKANIKIEEMENQTRRVQSAGSGLEGVFRKVAGAVAAIGIGMVLKNQAQQAIEFASDLTEVQNVVDVTFGQSAAVIDNWSKTTLNAFGLNELSAKQFSGTMGAMLKSSGLTGDAVQDMAMKITELSGDIASFYNLDAEEAFTKIRSGISGETEPLKQLGINMSVANLEAYAMAQGITTAYQDMDQAAQTTLRYNYLLQATADAQGDFARTSDSYANQTKLLQENWQSFTGTLASYALPMLANIMQYLNGMITNMQNYVPVIVSVATTVFNALTTILDGCMAVGSFISDNWSIIAPIIMGIAAAFLAYATALGIYNGVQAISNGIKAIAAFQASVHAAALAMESGATFAATATQYGFNAALLACPLTWIILLIIAVIAALVAVCAWIAKTSDTANSTFGVICGGINVVLQFFKNLGLSIANIALGIWSALGACASNIGIAFHNVIAGVQSWFYDLLSTALTVVSGICEALNKLPFVNFDYTGIQAKADDYAAKARAASGSKEEYQNVNDAYNSASNKYDTWSDGWAADAYKSGTNWGDGVSSKISDTLSNAFDTSSITAGLDTSSLDSAYTGSGTGSVADGVASTADNTSAISDGVDITNENLKYMRDAAEQEAINQFTTAQISVEMTNNNSVSSGMDLDGMVSALSDGVTEAMTAAAEGVH